ncbi:MAG: ABC transporter permease subunit, partial [Planctomycetota bacterium]|nr:ABC transporter permease subunit [Planctomycetota bacterium]
VLLLAGWLLQVVNTLLSAYSMGYSDSSEVSGDDKLLLDLGLATVFVVSTLLAGFIATAVLTREIENKTALTVISKPVGRPMFVLGKWIGVTGSIVLACIVLLVFFQFAIRHSVMTTARDHVDGPVIIFSLAAIFLSIGIGIWGNFFYGWVFSSVAVTVLLPASLVGWFGVLLINKDWEVQSIATDIKPQVLLASGCVLLSMPVLTAVAVAASTRLGQVMTIFVCAGVFLLGLLSNHFFGQRAYDNALVGRVASIEVVRDLDEDLSDGGDHWVVVFEQPPTESIEPGDSFYYGPTPDGVALVTPRHPRYEGDAITAEAAVQADYPPALVFRAKENVEETQYSVMNMGGLDVERLPRQGDYVFTAASEIHPVALGLWGVVPNLQFYWLVDAVTQTHDIPPRYMGLMGLYTVVQITGLLALAVILFQKREVG